jgi:hypothetical protein
MEAQEEVRKDVTPDLPTIDSEQTKMTNRIPPTLVHVSFLKHFMTPWTGLDSTSILNHRNSHSLVSSRQDKLH